MSLQLRPLQVNSINMLREAFRAGHRAVMLYGPTGFGKTEMAIALMQATSEKGNHSAMLLDRILLCDQTSLRLAKYSIEHGVLQSGHWRYRPEEKIQVCSAQTLEARGSFPRCELLIVDEAHAQRSETIEFIKAHPKIRVVGLSASPFTKGLGATYEHVVSATTTKELVDEGWLAPLRVFIAKEVDMTGAKKTAGEWTNKAATERGIKITGDIVGEWIQKTHEVYGQPRKTIVFCAGVEHGADLANRFAAAGYNFVSISYRDDDQFKKDVIDDFSKPDTSIHGVIATDILTKGFDVPDVMIGISARPFSKSFSSHVQQMGRVMRPHPGKEFALWLDHCIASGQRVLTQRGLVPIEEILLTDTLWDGHDFVAHKGVVSRGIRPVIRYAGLTATADHPVKTDKGWRALGYCAEEQTPVVTTGVGRKALRECRNHFTAGGVARGQGAALHACALRVRDMWLSLSDFLFQPDWRSHHGVQGMQPAEAVPEVAICADGCDEGTLHESEGRWVRKLRRQGDRIQVRLSDFLRSLDSSELRIAAECEGLGVGPQGQQRALRTWQHPMGDEAHQHQQSAHYKMDAAHAQVQAGTPGGSLCRRIIARVLGCWDELQGNRGAIPQAVEQAEGQVWDILEAGPRNCFTCEGLLVHNSGNYLRFRDDWDDLYANGVDKLDDGAEKTKPEQTAEQKEASKCPKCHSLWPRFADVCPSCGFAHPRRSEIVDVPGKLEELSGQAAEKYSGAVKEQWYQELLGYARNRGFNEGWAYHKYMEKFGVKPKWAKVAKDPGVEVLNYIKSRAIAFAKRRIQ